MHADEIAIDEVLVGRLVAAQFPGWAGLPVRRLATGGTDNALFRLGETLLVRLPLHPGAEGPVRREQRYLPRLAPHLPLPVPAPVGLGAAAEGYPLAWSICGWMAGEDAFATPPDDLDVAAETLAGFIAALRRLDANDGPRPGEDGANRGVPLATRDAAVEAALAQLRGEIDVESARREWRAALAATVFTGRPVWLHGDLHPANLLVRQGRLAAVIDFGCLVVGDPATDLIAAWTLFGPASRRRFRTALPADDATWMRGRGWALSMALIALPYYLHTNPTLVAISRRAIAEILAEPAGR
jgi:aminoglycoside phosphotransferase (APT) family kinase protein